MKTDYPQALYWYRKAAETGIPQAANGLGVMYQDGLGVNRDFQQAATWFRKAAEQGDVQGQFDLANLYMAGRGVPLDYVRAYFWYSLAASSGDNLSALQLKELRKLMTPRQVTDAQTLIADWRPAQPPVESKLHDELPPLRH